MQDITNIIPFKFCELQGFGFSFKKGFGLISGPVNARPAGLLVPALCTYGRSWSGYARLFLTGCGHSSHHRSMLTHVHLNRVLRLDVSSL